MKNLQELLVLDEGYTVLHYANFRKCGTDAQKERYTKQLCNMLARRNAHIHQEITSFRRDFQAYSWRHARRRVTKSRNASISRPIPRTECATAVKLPTEPFKPATANLSGEDVELLLPL